ncbi:hypothetical protein TWF281_011665 [Arthrobotrys megalospora]
MPFFNLFSGIFGSLEEFSFNILANSMPSMTAEPSELEGLELTGPGLELRPLSIPNLRFLDLGPLFYFENLSQFITLDSLVNVRFLSVFVDISFPYSDIVPLGPPEKKAEELLETLQLFKNLETLSIYMGELDPSDFDDGIEIIPKEFWDTWTKEVTKLCSVVPKLRRIFGHVGKTIEVFKLIRTGSQIRVTEVKRNVEREPALLIREATGPGVD